MHAHRRSWLGGITMQLQAAQTSAACSASQLMMVSMVVAAVYWPVLHGQGQ